MSPTATPKKNRKSTCPIARALEVIGDRWTLLILRDLFNGHTRYKEFIASPEKISTNILANRLANLCRLNLIENYWDESTGKHGAYRLTETGQTLEPVLKSIGAWGNDRARSF